MTVGAIVAALLAAANLIAVIAGWDGAVDEDDRARALALTILVRGRAAASSRGACGRRSYWAVLGMQTLLALTLIAWSSPGARDREQRRRRHCSSWPSSPPAGTLFWFMVKAMARIQMPERPGRSR